MLNTDLEARVLELRGKQYSTHEILKMTDAENVKQVQDILDDEKNRCIKAYKSTPKDSKAYQEVLLYAVKLLRSEYHLNYREIANELDESEYLIFDIIRRNSVSTGKNGNFIKGYFTREEKRMRNEDMVRLNKEGKTFAEIGRIFFTSKQNISQIFKEMGVKPVSEKEALAMELPMITGEDLAIKDKNKELRNKVRAVQRQVAMTKYHMNGLIQELRIKYARSLATIIEHNLADNEVIKEYKVVHQAIMRTYNNLVKTGSTDTALFRELNSIIPLLVQTNVKVK